MTKPDLLEVARQELGVEFSEASKLTVAELRELLKSHRQADQQTAQETFPLAHLPKGFSRLTHAALVAECRTRGLNVAATMGKEPTRAQLMMAIRDQVNEANGVTPVDWTMADSA